jgi:hypothetical protein
MSLLLESAQQRRRSTPAARVRPVDASAEAFAATADVLAVMVAAAMAFVLLLDVHTAVRPPLALVFVLVVPGWTLVRRLGATASLLTCITAIAVSVAGAMLVGQALVMLLGWHWYPAGLALSLACVVIGATTIHDHMPEWSALGARLARQKPAVTTGAVTSLMTVVAGNALVVLGIRRSSVSTTDVLGLVDRLSPLYWLGVMVILAGLVYAWSVGSRWAWLGVAALIVALHGLPGMLEPNPRFSVSWIHTGFSRQIAEHGTLLTNLDARFSWAGFFSGSAFLQRLSGNESVLWLVRYAPLFYNGCSVLLVALIARRLRSTEVQAGVAATFFCVLNWIAQDYFAPQATAFLLYLTVLLLLLTAFPSNPAKMPKWMARILRPAPDLSVAPAGRRPVVVLAGCCTIVVAMVISHQLTPAFLMSVTLLLVLSRTVRVWAFPIFCAVVFLAWVSYGADAYWFGHLDTLTGSVGQVSNIVGQNVGRRAQSTNTQRTIVVGSRIAIALAGWSAAGISLIRQWWRRRTPIALLAMLVAPFPMLALQPYGGEMALRVFLFTLPPVAILIAQLLVPRTFRVGGRRLLPVGIALALLVPVFILSRFGNEAFESFTDADVAINHAVYAVAPAGSLVYVDTRQAPIYSERVGEVRFRDLPHGTVTAVTKELAKQAKAHPIYVMLTESQAAYGTITDGRPLGWMTTFGNELLATGKYRIIEQDGGAALLQVVP